MTARHSTAYGSVRISPDGELIAWYRPYQPTTQDPRPWLVISEDPALGVEHEWQPDSAVADWAALNATPADTPIDTAAASEVTS